MIRLLDSSALESHPFMTRQKIEGLSLSKIAQALSERGLSIKSEETKPKITQQHTVTSSDPSPVPSHLTPRERALPSLITAVQEKSSKANWDQLIDHTIHKAASKFSEEHSEQLRGVSQDTLQSLKNDLSRATKAALGEHPTKEKLLQVANTLEAESARASQNATQAPTRSQCNYDIHGETFRVLDQLIANNDFGAQELNQQLDANASKVHKINQFIMMVNNAENYSDFQGAELAKELGITITDEMKNNWSTKKHLLNDSAHRMREELEQVSSKSKTELQKRVSMSGILMEIKSYILKALIDTLRVIARNIGG